MSWVTYKKSFKSLQLSCKLKLVKISQAIKKRQTPINLCNILTVILFNGIYKKKRIYYRCLLKKMFCSPLFSCQISEIFKTAILKNIREVRLNPLSANPTKGLIAIVKSFL